METLQSFKQDMEQTRFNYYAKEYYELGGEGNAHEKFSTSWEIQSAIEIIGFQKRVERIIFMEKQEKQTM